MAGEAKITRSVNISGGGVSIGGVTESVNVDHVKVFQKALPANLTDGRVTLAVDVSEVSVMAMQANKDTTVKTNSTSSPVDTPNLTANKARHWFVGDDVANKFLSADVTDFYFSTGGEETIVKIIIGQDSTPVLGG